MLKGLRESLSILHSIRLALLPSTPLWLAIHVQCKANTKQQHKHKTSFTSALCSYMYPSGQSVSWLQINE